MTSSINPNNIDGAYPVAGQDNNSQGFRDNFTNTSTNFQYAAAEITDLQNKAVLKAALTGTTLNNNMNGSILSNAQLQQMSNTVVALGTISGDVGINYTAGSYQTVTAAASISLAFTNWTPAGTQDCVLVQVTIPNISYTLTLPSAVGSGAAAQSAATIQGIDTGTNVITFGATGTYIFAFITTDGGTTIYINDLTRSRSVTFEDGAILVTDTTQSTSPSTGSIVTDGGVGVAKDLYVGGNILTGGLVSSTGNITAGNILTSGLVSSTGNTSAGNLRTGGSVSATGNVLGGNIQASGALSRALDVETINFANITATGTYSLSTTSSINVLVANNTGYTATLNMPATPVDGQICNFSISGNTVTLAAGTGTVLPTYAGSTTVGTGYRYVYRTSNTSWYRIG